MVLRNRIFPLCFRILTVGIGVSAIVTTMVAGGGFGSWAYYTLQSNLLVLGVTIALLVLTIMDVVRFGLKGESSHLTSLHFVTTVSIMITFLVFWVLLAPSAFSMSSEYHLWSYFNLTVHGIVPLLCLADYMIFNRPKKHSLSLFGLVTIFPLAYLAFALIMGFSGYVFNITAEGVPIRFPYFFIDYDKNGLWIIAWIFGVLLLFLAVAAILYFYDHFRIRRASREQINIS